MTSEPSYQAPPPLEGARTRLAQRDVDRAMDAVMQEHGITDDEILDGQATPTELDRLGQQWSDLADDEIARWYEELGAVEMAELMRHDYDAFFARRMEGYLSLAKEREG